MSIIISKQGEVTKKLDKSDFEKEDYLQNYIHKNPESIPVYEIEEDKKLFVVKREFPTNAGPIDALAVDKDGDIYIIETKLYKNPDKRTVVAQALDYGSALWRHLNDFGDFINTLNQETQKNFELDFQEKLEEFFGIDNDQSTFALDRLKNNLGDGNIKFVILMDSIEERLKDLIVYVNQNSQFDIYAVQLEYYKFNDYEIMIPKLFGVEVKKNIKSSGSSARRKWTRNDFLQDAKQKSGSYYKFIEEFLIFSEENASIITYGTGQEDGNFSYKIKTRDGDITVFCAYSDGEILARLGFIRDIMKRVPNEVTYLMNILEKMDGVRVENYTQKEILTKQYNINIREVSLEEIKKEVLDFTQKVKI